MLLSWAMAGGVAAGGIVVGALTLSGVVSPGFQLLAAPVLFLTGAALGFLHGALLALAGRPTGMAGVDAGKRCLVALLALPPALALAWLMTAGLSVTAALVTEWRLGWGLVAGCGWVGCLAVCAWAAVEGWRAVRRACLRWPHRREGAVLLGAAAVAMGFAVVRYPMRIPGAAPWLETLASLALGMALTIWVVLPAVVISLRLAHEWFLPRASGERVVL